MIEMVLIRMRGFICSLGTFKGNHRSFCKSYVCLFNNIIKLLFIFRTDFHFSAVKLYAGIETISFRGQVKVLIKIQNIIIKRYSKVKVSLIAI